MEKKAIAAIEQMVDILDVNNINKGLDEMFTWYFLSKSDASDQQKELVYATMTAIKTMTYELQKK